MSLTPYPPQPHLFLHPDFAAKMALANQYRGRPILLGNAKSPNGHYLAAWRSYADGVYLWNGWIHKLPGFSSASNPDSGPRSHQRGVGADLAEWGTATIAAVKRAGIQVNGVAGEPWHIQLPNFMAYPIIPTNTGTAGGTPVPIATDKDIMTLYFTASSASDDGKIGKGWGYILEGNGPIRAVTNLETFFWGPAGITPASISGNDLRLLSAVVGLAEYEQLTGTNVWGPNRTPLFGPGKLTGRVIYSGDSAHYPTVGVDGLTTANVDVKALAAEIVKQLPSVSGISKQDVIDAIKSVSYKAQ